MARSNKFLCPVCGSAIEAEVPEVDTCPACKEYILDKFPVDSKQGINTARTIGGEYQDPFFNEISDSE